MQGRGAQGAPSRPPRARRAISVPCAVRSRLPTARKPAPGASHPGPHISCPFLILSYLLPFPFLRFPRRFARPPHLRIISRLLGNGAQSCQCAGPALRPRPAPRAPGPEPGSVWRAGALTPGAAMGPPPRTPARSGRPLAAPLMGGTGRRLEAVGLGALVGAQSWDLLPLTRGPHEWEERPARASVTSHGNKQKLSS